MSCLRGFEVAGYDFGADCGRDEGGQGARYRYLWVDRYCIDQDDVAEKKEQIAQMDRIYRGAELTIIAAGTTMDWGASDMIRLLREEHPMRDGRSRRTDTSSGNPHDILFPRGAGVPRDPAPDAAHRIGDRDEFATRPAKRQGHPAGRV